MNNNSLIGKCIRVHGKYHGLYKIEGSERNPTYRRWSYSKKEWESPRDMDLDLDSITPSNCPDESKGGARKRNTRRKKSGTKRRHV